MWLCVVLSGFFCVCVACVCECVNVSVNRRVSSYFHIFVDVYVSVVPFYLTLQVCVCEVRNTLIKRGITLLL